MKALIASLLAVAAVVTIPSSGSAQAPPAAATPAPVPAKPAKLPPIARGSVQLSMLGQTTKVVGKEVVSTITVQNNTDLAIAGLVARLYFYDGSNPVAGDEQRLRKPFLPGETHTFEFKIPKTPQMRSSNFSFAHANGEIKVIAVKPTKPAVAKAASKTVSKKKKR